MSTNEKISLMATYTAGLESVIAKELKNLGYSLDDCSDGKALLEGELKDIAKININSRVAERLFIILKKYEAKNFEQLYDGLYQYDWKEIIEKGSKIVITKVKSKRSNLVSTRDIQSISQKAIYDKIRRIYGSTNNENGKTYNFSIYIKDDIAKIALDTSGEGLHKRGYRKESVITPLRETIAASMLYLSYWDKQTPLYDIFCGSGTIPIEAALLGQNIAPGLFRNFIGEEYNFIPQKNWIETREEAKSKIKKEELKITGSDTNQIAIDISEENAKRAGIEGIINFKKLPMEQTKAPYEKGMIVSNLPYGEKLKDAEWAQMLYMQMRHLKNDFPNWSYFFLTSSKDFEKHFDSKARRKKTITNSGIETILYFYS